MPRSSGTFRGSGTAPATGTNAVEANRSCASLAPGCCSLSRVICRVEGLISEPTRKPGPRQACRSKSTRLCLVPASAMAIACQRARCSVRCVVPQSSLTAGDSITAKFPLPWRSETLEVRSRRCSRGQRLVVNTYPEPETEKERSPIDFPQVKTANMTGSHRKL